MVERLADEQRQRRQSAGGLTRRQSQPGQDDGDNKDDESDEEGIGDPHLNGRDPSYGQQQQQAVSRGPITIRAAMSSTYFRPQHTSVSQTRRQCPRFSRRGTTPALLNQCTRRRTMLLPVRANHSGMTTPSHRIINPSRFRIIHHIHPRWYTPRVSP